MSYIAQQSSPIIFFSHFFSKTIVLFRNKFLSLIALFAFTILLSCREDYSIIDVAVVERSYSEGNLLIVLSTLGIQTTPIMLSKKRPVIETLAVEVTPQDFNNMQVNKFHMFGSLYDFLPDYWS